MSVRLLGIGDNKPKRSNLIEQRQNARGFLRNQIKHGLVIDKVDVLEIDVLRFVDLRVWKAQYVLVSTLQTTCVCSVLYSLIRVVEKPKGRVGSPLLPA